jgi:hypothetical protein
MQQTFSRKKAPQPPAAGEAQARRRWQLWLCSNVQLLVGVAWQAGVKR